ncbi:MAG: hypothetical protein H6708_19360 [Kofleriaceae bacterium]|nr:hypothetical protein [Myxococcales bacterium]MCB9562566.1 hypothetical protein [Kofleriaceae bacterium]
MPPPASDDDPLRRELALLRTARAALADDRPDDAVAVIDTYRRDFPDGQLAEEAFALEVEALCGLGRTDDADDALTALTRRWPASPHRARAARACDHLAPEAPDAP